MENEYQADRKEHFLYGFYFFGQNFLWAFAALISTYLLDTGIKASAASVILLVPKIWDAVNDMIFGVIVDKYRISKKEQFMPWIRIGTSTIAFTTILLFSIPESLQLSHKIGWFIITYILFDASYTLLDAPIYAMPSVMSTNVNERARFVSDGKIWGILGGALATILVPLLRPKIGWTYSACVFALGGAACMVPFLFTGKERTAAAERKKEPALAEIFSYLRKNRYLRVTLAIMLVIGCCSVDSVLALIVARNCLKNESLAFIVTLAVGIVMMLVSVITPKLVEKWDKYHILLYGLLFSILASLCAYFIGYNNIVLMTVFLGLKGVGFSFYTIICYMFVADTLEYGAYKSGVKAAGVTFSLQSFVAKLKNALLNSVALWALALFGYDSSLAENVQQSARVVSGIWTVFNLLPAIGYLIAVILLIVFYHLRDRDVQIMADFNNGKLSKEEAEEKLKERYGSAYDE